MGENSAIEWTTHTFNPWVGCTEVSPACDHCYARVQMTRKPRWATAWSGDRFRTTRANWRDPLKWNAAARVSGVRDKVFCASLADVFDNQIDPAWRDDLWGLIEATPHLDWLLLTKRPQNIARMLPNGMDYHGLAWAWGDGWPNVWLGTTVENQEEADRRIPHLLAASAKVRFLSCEPLLGPVDLTAIRRTRAEGYIRPLDGRFNRIHWVIAGGESGPGARPSHPDWFRSLRDQCVAADVPFFFKQVGDWAPNAAAQISHVWSDGLISGRIGKAKAGALLDGVEHKAMPA